MPTKRTIPPVLEVALQAQRERDGWNLGSAEPSEWGKGYASGRVRAYRDVLFWITGQREDADVDAAIATMEEQRI